MNNRRRKRLREIVEAISVLKERLDLVYQEETAAFKNIPTSSYDAEQYEQAEQLCDRLCYAVEQLEDSIEFITSVIE